MADIKTKMDEYIEREALREILDGWRDAHADVDDVHGCGLLEDVICEVDAQAAADVAPVVHARWIYVEETLATSSGYCCSACRRPRWLSPDVPEVFKYCPKCGAKMDGGADHEDD